MLFSRALTLSLSSLTARMRRWTRCSQSTSWLSTLSTVAAAAAVVPPHSGPTQGEHKRFGLCIVIEAYLFQFACPKREGPPSLPFPQCSKSRLCREHRIQDNKGEREKREKERRVLLLSVHPCIPYPIIRVLWTVPWTRATSCCSVKIRPH